MAATQKHGHGSVYGSRSVKSSQVLLTDHIVEGKLATKAAMQFDLLIPARLDALLTQQKRRVSQRGGELWGSLSVTGVAVIYTFCLCICDRQSHIRKV